MLSPILIWLAQQGIALLGSYLLRKLGEPEVRIHFEKVIENAKPLPPDPLPSPTTQRNPNQRKLLGE